MEPKFEHINAPCLVPEFPINNNFFHRVCKQLENYLIKNRFQVSEVSRVDLGSKKYYAVETTLPKGEFSHDKTRTTYMGELFGVEGIGLADFYVTPEGVIHQVILIDEDELNEKYLKDGNLVFSDECMELKLNTICDMIDNVDTENISVLLQLSDIRSYIHKIIREDFK